MRAWLLCCRALVGAPAAKASIVARHVVMAAVDPKRAHAPEVLERARRLEDVVGDSPQRVFDFLFIGDAEDAQDAEKLRRRGITAVVNMAWIENPFEEEPLGGGDSQQNEPPLVLEYLKLDVLDAKYQDMTWCFEQTAEFIEFHRSRGGRVLVHCHAGMSRAPSVCVAYCVRCLDMELARAYSHVRTCRGIIFPNDGFLQQLIRLEHKLRGYTTMGWFGRILRAGGDCGFRKLTEEELDEQRRLMCEIRRESNWYFGDPVLDSVELLDQEEEEVLLLGDPVLDQCSADSASSSSQSSDDTPKAPAAQSRGAREGQGKRGTCVVS